MLPMASQIERRFRGSKISAGGARRRMTALGRQEREREGEQRYRNEEAKIPINREARVRTASGQKEKTDAGSRKNERGGGAPVAASFQPSRSIFLRLSSGRRLRFVPIYLFCLFFHPVSPTPAPISFPQPQSSFRVFLRFSFFSFQASLLVRPQFSAQPETLPPSFAKKDRRWERIGPPGKLRIRTNCRIARAPRCSAPLLCPPIHPTDAHSALPEVRNA